MAVSQIQFRSISLPSRLHPISSAEFEAELQKLKSLQTSCASKAVPVSSETIQTGLLGLAELYNSVEELTQSCVHQHGKSIEDSLEGSVELLDSCNTIRELVQMIKENVQALQSALRRKGLDSSIQNDVASYFCLRKKMNKIIAKSLKTLKNLQSKNGSNLEDESWIKEMNGHTIAIFKSILVFLSWPSAYKPSGWKLVSKLMLTKSHVEQSVVTETGFVDFALNTIRRSDYKDFDLQMVQRNLGNLDVCIEGIEGGLERLFRQLVRSRVALLNILTDCGDGKPL